MELTQIEEEIQKAIESGKNRFFLKNKGITELPESIGNLSEVEEMSLIGNKLTSLPSSFSKLTALRRLHLSSNDFESIPNEIFQLPNLQHICIRHNKISTLPENIGDLIHIRDIDLDSNRISSIPLTIENVEIIFNLSVWHNPLIDPPIQILEQGIETLKTYIAKKGRVLLYTINLPQAILTPFKQYLLSFPDFVKASKGRNMSLEVKSVNNGILVQVECESESDLERFEEYMTEYSGFVKQNVEDIDIKFEVEAVDTKKELLLHQTRQEVQFLKMKCDNIEFQKQYLEKDNNFLKSLVLEMAKQQPMLSFDIKQLQASTFNNTISNNINNDVEKLRDSVLELFEIQSLVDENEELLTEIKEELDTLTKLEEEEIKKSGVFDKIKSLIAKGATIVKGADESFESISNLMEKFAKISELIKPFL